MSQLLACNRTHNASKDLYKLDLTFSSSDNIKIFGTWSMCSISNGYNMMQMNLCPSVTFFRNGLGQVSINGLPSESFRWNLKSSHLEIISNLGNNIQTFADTNYLVKFNSIDSSRMELVISHNLSSYYLSK